MDSSDARGPRSRPALPSITREVNVDELRPLVDATRGEGEKRDPERAEVTASLAGAELDQLLESERRGFARVAVPPTAVPVAPAPAQIAEPTVVIAPGLDSPRDPRSGERVSLPTMVLPQGEAAWPKENEGPTNTPHAPPQNTVDQGFLNAPAQAHAAPWTDVSAPPIGAPPPRAVAAEPDWASRTHLPVSRETVRTARKSWVIVIASAAVSLAVVAVIAGVWLTRGGQSLSNAPAAGSASSDVTASATSRAATTNAVPSGSSNVSPSASANAATPPTPDSEARAALTRLRDGIGTCVRDVIGVLPGSSPAVPDLMSRMKKGSYKSHVRDFRSPVFSCAKYRETEPQRFQIQWQMTKRPSEGRGVAWLDDDGDGKADRALSFRASLVRKKEVDLGEIELVSPVPPVMKPTP